MCYVKNARIMVQFSFKTLISQNYFRNFVQVCDFSLKDFFNEGNNEDAKQQFFPV